MNNALRARVIAEWRGLPETPFPADDAKLPGPILARMMKDLGLTERVTEEQIMSAWLETVGEFLAQHSRPHRLIEGVLYVRVLQSSMHFELERTWKADILRKLKARFGRTVRDVRFKVG